MSAPREQILRSIRRSLKRRGPLAPSVAAALAARLAAHHGNVRPALGGDPVARFAGKVQAVAGSVREVAGAGAVSQAVLEYLSEHSLPFDVVMGGGPLLDTARWPNALAAARRAATGDDRVSVTGAFAGVAESGTLVLLSSRDSPTTHNFLPEVHIAVLDRSRIVPYLEDVWRWLREEQPAMPRTVNLITGPSRTADVELTLQLGAHGPRRLHVIIVGPRKRAAGARDASADPDR